MCFEYAPQHLKLPPPHPPPPLKNTHSQPLNNQARTIKTMYRLMIKSSARICLETREPRKTSHYNGRKNEDELPNHCKVTLPQ